MEQITTKILCKELSYEIQGAAIEVRKNFGPGHKENIYQNAFAEELTSQNIGFEREKNIQIRSPKTGKVVGYYKPDFIIDGKILVELKALEKTPRLAIDQLYDYLKNSEYELGYFINFSAPKLLMKRIIFTNDRKFLNRTAKTFVALSFIFVVLGVGAFFGRARAISIRIYFNAPEEVAIGQEFPVKLLVDSDQPLNAYAIGFSYPTENLSLVGFDNSKSIIDIWQDQPTAHKSGSVNFSGGSISPWRGVGGNLISVRFRAIKDGTAALRFGNSSFYLANGKGTKVIPQSANLELGVLAAGAAPAPIYEEAAPDSTPPTIKYLSLIPDPFNSRQKLLSFMVSDAESGIKETLIRTRSFLFWNDWVPARNPMAIPLSVCSVGFKTIDNKDNVSEKTLYNSSALLQPAALAIATLFIISLLIIGFTVLRIKRRQPRKVE